MGQPSRQKRQCIVEIAGTLAGRTAIVEVNSFLECEKTKDKGTDFVPDI